MPAIWCLPMLAVVLKHFLFSQYIFYNVILIVSLSFECSLFTVQNSKRSLTSIRFVNISMAEFFLNWLLAQQTIIFIIVFLQEVSFLIISLFNNWFKIFSKSSATSPWLIMIISFPSKIITPIKSYKLPFSLYLKL